MEKYFPPTKPKTSLIQKCGLILFGLFLAACVIEVGLRAGGAALLLARDYKNVRAIKEKGSYRILCLGESTTFNHWPRPLEELLNQQGLGVKFSVIDAGLPGLDTTRILRETQDNLEKYSPHMIVAMMGINDGRDKIVCDEETTGRLFLRFLRNFRIYKLAKMAAAGLRHEAPQEAQAEQISPGLCSFLCHQAKKEYAFKNHDRTELLSKLAIKVDPKSSEAHSILGNSYFVQKRYVEAEAAIRKCVELAPNHLWSYFRLAQIFVAAGKDGQVREQIEQLFERGTERDAAFFIVQLVDAYNNFGCLGTGETLLKEIFEKYPNSVGAHVGLGYLYGLQARYDEGRQMLEKAIELYPEDDSVHYLLAQLFEKQGDDQSALDCYKKAAQLRMRWYNTKTHKNYRALREIARKNNIKLVCVQYPVRSVEPLKNIFEGEDDDIIFVDNEKIFKDAVAQKGYEAYFSDRFGVDFGHETKEGDRLLAENIARVIMRECFHASLRN